MVNDCQKTPWGKQYPATRMSGCLCGCQGEKIGSPTWEVAPCVSPPHLSPEAFKVSEPPALPAFWRPEPNIREVDEASGLS